MAELVDALVSDASGATRVSSSLISHTKNCWNNLKNIYNYSCCPSGEIGRRTGLKIQR